MRATRRLSLRIRLLWPLLATSAASAVVVAILSSWVGRQWAIHDVQERFDAINSTIQHASFPLTTSVVSSLAKLSGTELIALDNSHEVQASTLENGSQGELSLDMQSLAARAGSQAETAADVRVGGLPYLALSIRRALNRNQLDSVGQVIVLFDETRVQAAGRRAGLIPLVTGISTIVLLTTLLTAMTGRLVSRLQSLQRSVELVAGGNFDSRVADTSTDEIGRLGQSIDKMAVQLNQLWQQVNRQQSQKLLHQIAGGMAHQLRNTLTGARLALEIHRQRCPSADNPEVDVALREMRGAEDYVRRLLMVGAGEQQVDQAAAVLTCLNDVRSSHVAVAKHLRVQLHWDLDQIADHVFVADGSTFSAAISNLVLNGLHAAQNVQVTARLEDSTSCVVTVEDDGPGIDSSMSDVLFEPFATTKQEGIGLGLPLVRRSAEKLSGTVEWRHQDDRTVFEFRCKVLQSVVK